MRTKLRSKISLLFMTCAVLLAIPATALADTTIADGDGLAPLADNNMAFGSVCSGVESSKSAPVFINRNGTGTNVFANSSTATVTITGVTGAGLSAQMGTPNTITLPSDWSGKANNTQSASVSSTVKLNSSVAGPGSGTVSYVATGKNAAGDPLTRSDTMNVSWTTANCDTTAPTLNLPDDITQEASGASGNVVTFTATADDANPAHPTVNCTPTSGSTFALGTTTVNCEATDAAGNKATGSFTVTVRDTTAPAIDSHADVTEEATGPDGANVSYTSPGTTDAVDGPGTANCTPASGTTFALGSTTVTCTAKDAAGNEATSTFNVIVKDTTAPAIAAHADVNATATGANGALVSYTSPGTTDAVAGNGTANCTPASGSQFAVGSTKVTCTATDGTNTSTSSFNVIVAYSWSNFLQPINVTGTQSVFKLGSTVPVKFNLTGASSGITDGTFYLKYIYLGAGDGLGEQEAVATTTATTGTEFRYSAGQYIYNWSTKSVSKPGNYELRVYSDSAGTVLLGKVAIEIKK